MDNFDFEEDFNEEYEEGTPESSEHLGHLKDRLARANYEAIVKHGIDKDKTRDPDMIRHIIEETMFYFEELEEYEKCAELKREIESFKQDI
jgi:hypothetical protein|tara:strand:- start:3603 stop:3875 length:273 start_codon:yes stop_codon:yes gene_type:complete